MMRPCILQIKNTSIEENKHTTCFSLSLSDFFLSPFGELPFYQNKKIMPQLIIISKVLSNKLILILLMLPLCVSFGTSKFFWIIGDVGSFQ